MRYRKMMRGCHFDGIRFKMLLEEHGKIAKHDITEENVICHGFFPIASILFRMGKIMKKI